MQMPDEHFQPDVYAAECQAESVAYRETRIEKMEYLVTHYHAMADMTWTEGQMTEFLEDCQNHCFWPLIIQLSNQHIQMLNAHSLEMAAYASVQMGLLDTARMFIRRGLLTSKNSRYLIQLTKNLDSWADFCCQYPLSSCYSTDETGIYLQLLGQHHTGSFMSIYDANTAALCCLPEFVDAGDWHQWLEEQCQMGDQLTYAVMHPDFGMLGSVSLVLNGDTGFFYYWIGQDFRGRSYGPTAVRLLLENAQAAFGLTNCYAKVFEENEASRRGLSKLGFSELPIRAAEPYQNEIYYCLEEIADLDLATEHMYRFYQKIKCWKPFTRPLMGVSA